MRLFCSIVVATALIVTITGGAGIVRAEQSREALVTFDRLLQADSDPSDWLTYGKDLQGHRFSELKDITVSNVRNLVIAWHRRLGPDVSMEGTPIIVNGVMYVTTGKATVYALDAKTGATHWKYVYELPSAVSGTACCNYNNRGLTPYKHLVIEETLDAHLIALDAKTGKVQWNATVAPYKEGYSITSPPLLVGHFVITGVAGGEYATRGFIAAFDADTGKQVWKTYSIPEPGQPYSWTWKDAAWRAGGGSTWVTGTYDPDTKTLFWGVGNPNPDWDPSELMPQGSMLYTDSLLAMDPETGKIKWFYQYTPHDIFDYDGVNEAVIVDLPMPGRIEKAVVSANRNGYLYLLDRTNGKVLWVKPFVDELTWGKIDERTGKLLSLDPQVLRNAPQNKPYLIHPGQMGGKNWPPTAYDARKHLFFIPIIESCDEIVPNKKGTTHNVVGRMRLGGGLDMTKCYNHGSIAAWDLLSGKQVWKTHLRSPQLGGLLATAGGLLFAGDPEGYLLALNEDDGKILWRQKLPSGVTAPPVSYAVDGQQYIAVEDGTGGAWAAFFVQSTPWLAKVPYGAYVYAFKLGTHEGQNVGATRGGDVATTTMGNPVRGAKLFAQNCATCHGSAGSGGIGDYPALVGERYRKSYTQIIAQVENPRPPMPTFYPSPLSAQDVRDVASYIYLLRH